MARHSYKEGPATSVIAALNGTIDGLESDVYCGVSVILDAISGKRTIDELRGWVEQNYPERLKEMPKTERTAPSIRRPSVTMQLPITLEKH